jgi:hypothetical protein
MLTHLCLGYEVYTSLLIRVDASLARSLVFIAKIKPLDAKTLDWQRFAKLAIFCKIGNFLQNWQFFCQIGNFLQNWQNICQNGNYPNFDLTRHLDHLDAINYK